MDRGIEQPRLPERASWADWFFLLRPMILIPVWTFFLLGAWHGSRAAGAARGIPALLAGAAAFTAIVAAAYIVNQITDRETDRAAGKLFLVSHGIIPVRAAWVLAGALASGSIAASALFLSRTFLIIVIAGGVLGAAYSLEPVRLKRRPVLDVLANAVANGVINTLAGWAASGASLEGLARLAPLAPYPVAVAAVHLSTTLADIEGDRATGLLTSGVVLGRGPGLVLSTVLMAGAVTASAITGNSPALYASAASLLFFICAAISGRKRASEAGILLPAKGSTLAFSVAACVLFPAYLPLVALVVILTRVYYGRRFSMRYPSL